MNSICALSGRQFGANSATIYSSPNGFIEIDQSDLCEIDEDTARSLELIENNVDNANRKHSLFGYLNTNSLTTTGARLIRHGILKPLCNHEILEHRLDCVDYFVGRVDTLASITNSIRKFGQNIDLDNVIPVLVNLFKTRHQTLAFAEKRLDALTTLETLISQIPPLLATLDLADQPTLNLYKAALKDPAYEAILEAITSVIESDVKTVRGKRCKMFRIKQGIEALFDIARSTYTAAINDLEQYVRELHKEDGLSWKLSHNETRGYYLTLPANQIPKNHVLGPRYLCVNKSRSLISCTTRSLMQSNVRANVSYENSMKLANEVLTSCLGAVMNNLTAIYKLVDIIGELDVITSFAKLASSSNGKLIRPIFSPSDTIIEKSRHPVLETILKVNNLPIVANDVVLSTSRQNLILITGPNMGGKSIYLKQIGIIQVLAQMGCYVPAEKAHIRIMNRIVARSGTGDDSSSSCSSFMWEMKSMANALKCSEQYRDQSTLYLIDEVGRGTSIDDGASYSLAIAEELALRRYCFTVFATHFDQVFSLASIYGNIAAYHFKYDKDESEPEKVVITHNLIPGFADKTDYGIKLAELCGLPEELITVAKSGYGCITI